MSVLVVGISHNSAPVALLERVAPDADAVPKLVQKAAASEHVTEATVIATCNRVEIYAEVDRFHGSVEELSMLLVERAGGDDRGDAAAPLRPLRRRRGLAPLPGGRGARLDGRRRGPDPRPDPRRAAAGPGARHRRTGPQRALPAGAAGRQALPRGDRHRPGRADARRCRPDQVLDQRGRRTAGPRRRRRRHGRPRDRHRVPARRRVGHRRQPDARPRPAARHGVRRDAGHPRRPARRARRGRPGDRLRRRVRCPGHPGDGRGGADRRPPDGVHRPGAPARRRPGGQRAARRHPARPGRPRRRAARLARRPRGRRGPPDRHPGGQRLPGRAPPGQRHARPWSRCARWRRPSWTRR